MSRFKRRNVTFELPEAIYEALKDDADRVGEKSIHQRARLLLIEHYSTTPIAEVAQSVQDQKDLLAHVIELVRRLAYATLVKSSESDEDVEEAENWIRHQMPRTPEEV